MLKRYHQIVGGIFRTVDACTIGLAWILAFGLRFYFPIVEVTKGFPGFQKYAALCPLVVVLWMATFSNLKVYHSRRMLRRTDEVYLLLKAHGIALLLFIAITYLFSEYRYSRGVMVYFGLIGAVALIGLRLLLRNGLRQVRRRGFNLRHVILVGEGIAVRPLINSIRRFPELGLRVLGVAVHQGSVAKTVYDHPVIGHFEDLKTLVSQYKPDQILIALPRQQYADLDQILNLLREETVDIQLVPDVHEYVTLGCQIEDFDGTPIVNINDSPLGGWGAIAKRITDVLLAAIFLILLFPLFILIGFSIRLTSPGSILYRQERMGLDGRTFKMLKFRSMRANAERETGAIWAQRDDNRRTTLGSFLRSTSLDELPQFWNVLKGEMSLVGPRPERPIFVQQFRQNIPHYMLRHKVKAGITGWAQVNGWRGNTSLDQRIECDLYYIRNWSYIMDLKILFLTLWKGLINKNAY